MRRLVMGAALALAALVALGTAALVPPHANALGRLALAGVLAVSLLVDVDLPDGSHVPVGNAVVMAYVALFPSARAAAVIGLAVVLAASVWLWRVELSRLVSRLVWVALASAAAIGAHAAVAPFVERAQLHGDVAMLAKVGSAGAGFLLIELGVRGWLLERLTGRERDESGPLRATLRVHVALLCAAALLAVADAQKGPVAALVAAIPLVVIRFSFARYADARRTYEQAVRALSIVPEVAGLTPLGHGARTAVYASALVDTFDLERSECEQVVTAARLHHIGLIALDERAIQPPGPDPLEFGKASSEILSETGFLDGVADLVHAVASAEPGEVDLPCAIVRVASSFDELTADDPSSAGEAAVALLARHSGRIERTVAVALVHLCDDRPDLIERAWARGHLLSVTADNAGPRAVNDHGHGHGEEHLCL